MEVPEETKKCLKRALQEVLDNGLSKTQYQELTKLVLEYTDIFRTKLGSDPPAKLPPMILVVIVYFYYVGGV